MSTFEWENECRLFTMEHPLLDIIGEVDQSFLNKYRLQPDGQTLFSEINHQGLFQEFISMFKVVFVPGGATQNTARIVQSVINANNRKDNKKIADGKRKGGDVVFVGSVGEDKYSEILKQASEENGVRVEYLYLDNLETGTCAVLLTGNQRSLVAKLSAANCYQISHLEEIWSRIIEKCKYYYISGFFLSTSFESVMKIAKHCNEKNKIFTFNLGAGFICSGHSEQLMECLYFCDVVFSNENEASIFARVNKFEKSEDIQEIALWLSNLPKCNAQRKRIVIITQGANPTILAQDGLVQIFPVLPISSEEIVDTNGAGDAFVGGFLSHYIEGKSIHSCLSAAHFCARMILMTNGVTIQGDFPKVDF